MLDWHCFDCANEISWLCRNTFFFASNERYLAFTNLRREAVVHFAGQQAKRKANHSGSVFEHSLQRLVCFARVRRSEKSSNSARFVGRHSHALKVSTRLKTHPCCELASGPCLESADKDPQNKVIGSPAVLSFAELWRYS